MSSQLAFTQYKVDSTLKKEYLRVLENLDPKFKDEINGEYKKGLSLLYDEKTDTLNKKDMAKELNSIKLEPIDPITGEVDTSETNLTYKEEISKNQPFPLNCSCLFKKDTLIIASSIYLFSGYMVEAKVFKGNVKATYTEVESEEKSLKRTLKEQKRFEITIPAKVNYLTLDRNPNPNIQEIFGNISITSNGYYSYINAFAFETDYIYKRTNLQFLFRCSLH